MFLSSLYICKELQTQCIIHYYYYYYFGFFLHAHPKKYQNNQRIDGGRILVEGAVVPLIPVLNESRVFN